MPPPPARACAGTYTDLLPKNGYLTSKSQLNLQAFEAFVRVLATQEPIAFERKRQRAAGGGGGGRYSRRDARGRPPAAARPPSDPLEYKREYYLQKCGLHPNDAEARRSLVQSYLEGLSWCLAYYHEGCASWDWCASHAMRAQLAVGRSRRALTRRRASLARAAQVLS